MPSLSVFNLQIKQFILFALSMRNERGGPVFCDWYRR